MDSIIKKMANRIGHRCIKSGLPRVASSTPPDFSKSYTYLLKANSNIHAISNESMIAMELNRGCLKGIGVILDDEIFSAGTDFGKTQCRRSEGEHCRFPSGEGPWRVGMRNYDWMQRPAGSKRFSPIKDACLRLGPQKSSERR